MPKDFAEIAVIKLQPCANSGRAEVSGTRCSQGAVTEALAAEFEMKKLIDSLAVIATKEVWPKVRLLRLLQPSSR